jgi:hypothetical protein
MTVWTAEAAMARKANARANEGKPWSASCSLMESIWNTCEADWGSASAITGVVTAKSNTAGRFKVGSYGSKSIVTVATFVPAEDAAGMLAWAVTASAGATVAPATHAIFWMYSDTAIPDLSIFSFGLDQGATFANLDEDGKGLNPFPAIALAAGVLTRICVPLLAYSKALTSVDSLGFCVNAALPAVTTINLYFDDIRLVYLANDGDSEIKLADSHTESAAAAYKFTLPFIADKVDLTSGDTSGGVSTTLPSDCTLQHLFGTRKGKAVKYSTSMFDLPGACDHLILTPSADLAATEWLALSAVEMEAV